MKRGLSHRVLKKVILFTACVSAALILALPQGAAAAGDEMEKALGVRVAEKPFQVTFEPTKATYQAGEAIGFRVSGNKGFFLYVFSINEAERTARLLLPNSRHGNKYEAGKTYPVPNPDMEFYAARPGLEKLVAVASTRYIELNTGHYSKSGMFPSTTLDEAEAQIKALGVRSEQGGAERVVREMTLRITPGPLPPQSPAVTEFRDARPMPFISCDRESYRMGEVVRVIFGADRPGWVHVYVVEPGGRRVFLKREKVSGENVFKLRARAEYPAGDHVLVAVYSEDERAEGKSIHSYGFDRVSKGLGLLDPETPPYAVYRFRIIE